MTSAKGKPTDPKLKDKVTQEVKQQPNKDGSGKGQMAAWKAAKIGKEYEARGGDYTNEAGSKNKPEKGPPQKKSEATKKAELHGSKEGNKEEEEKPKGSSRPKVGKSGGAMKKKEPREGERKSARQAGKGVEDEAGKEKTGEKRKSTVGEEKVTKKSKN